MMPAIELTLKTMRLLQNMFQPYSGATPFVFIIFNEIDIVSINPSVDSALTLMLSVKGSSHGHP